MAFDVADTQTEDDRAPIALEYAAKSPPTDRPRRAWWLVLSLPALPAPFTDFVHHISPLDAVRSGPGELLLLGAGFFVGLILYAWRFVLVVCVPPRKVYVQIAVAFAVVAWALCAFNFVLLGLSITRGPSSISWSELLVGALPLEVMGAALIVGLLILAQQLSWSDRPGALTTALTTPFLGNSIFCLLDFRESQDAGYWLTLYVVIFWSAELMWDAIRPIANRFRRGLPP